MKKLLASITLAAFALSMHAQDRALLETLVKKGMLTQQEAAQIAKESVAVKPNSKTTKAIIIFGGVQGWFKWSDNHITEGSGSLDEISGFELRYVKVGMEADVAHGWKAALVMDFGSEGDTRNYLDKVVISKKIDIDYVNGELQIGMKKTNMGVEQITDDFGLLAIDRSVATNFFTHAGSSKPSELKCFGSRTIGIFWDGEIPQVEGLYYGAAVTSEITEGSTSLINNINANSGLSYYVSVGYKNVIALGGENTDYDFGINAGYASKGFTRTTSTSSDKSEVWGVNPYLKIRRGGLSMIAEMFYQSVEYGKTNNESSSPLGANLILAYKIDVDETIGSIEPVLRLSYVTADTMGVAVTADNKTYCFNEAKTVYVGLNWYTTDAIKTSFGYEYGSFEGGTNPAAANKLQNNTVLAQLQVVF